MSLQGKIALVTGATRGIGKAIALQLAKQGVMVAGTATSQSGADKISAMFTEAGLQGAGFVLNVTDSDAIAATVKAINDQFGVINILVNNAGITQDNLFLRMKPEQWDSVINTNLNSLYHLTKVCIRPMLKARWGRIINITSVVAVSGNPGQANYCSAKAGMIGFTKSIGQEFAAKGITANSVAPGFISTDMTNALTDDQKEAICSAIPMKKIGEPDDIANTVTFLASDDAKYITGQTLHVNGGMYMS